MTDKVEVTQSAKEAALAVMSEMGRSIIQQAASQDINVTLKPFSAPDDHPLVQAIAAAEQRGFKRCQDAAELLGWLAECDNLVLFNSYDSAAEADMWQVRRATMRGELRGQGLTPAEALNAARTLSIKEASNGG